ncbi:MAG: hypothetical protein IIX92_04255 [Selenomonadales bacterium]|nr:hypothetical protein [Selenomonadales bacterium]
MSELYINGGKRLVGEVTINGAKNAAVAILPAALLVDGISIIENLPYIDDVQKLTRAMGDLGAVTELEDKHTLKVDASTLFNYKAINDYVGHIRASYYLIGERNAQTRGRFRRRYGHRKHVRCAHGQCYGAQPYVRQRTWSRRPAYQRIDAGAVLHFRRKNG